MKTISIKELINGLHSITRMRGEIALIVSGLQGRLRKVPDVERFEKLVRDLVLREDRATWVVSLARNGTRVICRKDAQVVFDTDWKNDSDDIGLVNVEFVYDALQILVDGVVEVFPKIREDAEAVSRLSSKF